MEVTRRTALRLGLGAVVVGVATVCDPPAPTQPSPATTPPTTATTAPHDHASMPMPAPAPPSGAVRSQAGGGQWSKPATWVGGVVPAGGAAVVISGPVVLDLDAVVASLDIDPGASLTFDPAATRSLHSSGNIVNRGLVSMRPTRATNIHQIIFTGVNEAAFVGGGMSVIPTDVGLWVMDDGTLDLFGQPKTPWLRAADSLSAGQRSIVLDGDPSGWQVGDEIVVTPTLPVNNDAETGREQDLVTVSSISGRTIGISRPLSVAHPAVPAGPRGTLTAEVLNLSRNVRIEGTPSGRSHVFIHATRPQAVKYVGLRNLGPRQRDAERDSPDMLQDVMGRYALHFHHCGGGSRGSHIEGVVARDLGAHAFVPHSSDGTTWTNCIAHETNDFAYWWDLGDSTADTVFDRCVASSVGANSPNMYINAGFMLGDGPDGSNVVRNCVATNVSGDGFFWPDGGEAVWVFTDSFTHNNEGSGLRVWQNDSLPHTVAKFTSYNNGDYGIDQGAYANSYHYEDGVLVGNANGAIVVRAVSVVGDDGAELSFSRLYCDATGTDHAIELPDGGPVSATRPTVIRNCEFHGARKSAIAWYVRDDEGRGTAPWATVTGCTFDGNELWLDRGLAPSSKIAFSSPARGNLAVKPAGQPGTPVPAWNAVTQPA